MTLLIANIGTSDLAINFDGYYFPVGFDREERNIQHPEPGSIEEALGSYALMRLEKWRGMNWEWYWASAIIHHFENLLAAC